MQKHELLQKMDEQHDIFTSAIENLDENTLQQPGVIGAWSIKDILIHISRWEAELVKLLWQARQGQRPTTAHFSGVPLDETNQQFYSDSRSRPLVLALDDYYAVRNQTLLRVEDFTERELTDPQHFPWQKAIPLWQWIASDTFEHEAEHLESIQVWISQNPALPKEVKDAP
jgi:hypothetical protein